MRNKSKLKVIILTLGILIAVVGINNCSIFNDQKRTFENRDGSNLPRLKRSAGYTENFIHIDGSIPGNWSWTAGNYSWCYIDNGVYIIENVTIDASGSPTGNGILINNSKNDYFTLRNCTVYNAGSGGIRLENTDNGNLINNTFTYNAQYGIILHNNCINNTIFDNIVNDNTVHGILLREFCENNIVSGNNVSNNNLYGIHVRVNSSYNTISGNTINNNIYGIHLYHYCDDNTISGNTVSYNTLDGIYLSSYCEYNTISGNTANNNRAGIRLYGYCDATTISGNTVSYNALDGIYLDSFCEYNTISGNTATNNYENGIHLYLYSDANIISGNNATNNYENGIYLEDNCDNNIISENTANNNENAIYLYFNCDNSTIIFNLISDNTCSISIAYSDHNLVYHNNFTQNTFNAIDDGTNNQWDNGFIGNYWHNFIDSDINDDGIGDILDYEISGSAGNQDTLPFCNDGYDGGSLNVDDIGYYSWNWKFSSKFDWCSGDGSWGDPYTVENVIINASGSPTGNGILINNSKNDYFTLRNCTVYNAGSGGIRLENTDNGNLINNTCTYNAQYGIILHNNCINSTIFDNIVNDNTVHGILLREFCENNIVSGNNVSNNNQHGIHVRVNSSYNTISGNTINNNGWCGIMVRLGSSNNIISGNTVNNNDHEGIHLYWYCADNTISGNIVTHNGRAGGIYLYSYCDDNTISGNTANNNDHEGIHLDIYCDANTISGNTVDNNLYGIRLYHYCDDNTISGNTVSYNTIDGIFLSSYCDANTISGNTANNNRAGIRLYGYCDATTISGNTANYNYHGIHLEDQCNQNTIYNNIICFNENGAYLYDYCDDNIIYLNCFTENRDNAFDNGHNQWDWIVSGNYWDDYSGPDIDNNGIGDLPYYIPPNSVDTKPLMYANWDLDGDSFSHSVELELGTDPWDPLWYPMPNLKVSHFSPVIVYETTSFGLDFSITNNGIWKAEGVIVIVKCNELDLTLFNNTNTPLTLEVDETEYLSIGIFPFESIGTFTLNLTIDPDNNIAETYSNKDGSLRLDAENDNSQTAELTILPEIKVLNLAFETQSFSSDDFNISFFISNDTGQYIDFATVQMWWNGNDVSDDVQNLGNGLYFVSLEPITIIPGEDPILLKMIISADGYEDTQFETYLAVDPNTLNKVGKPAEGIPLVIILIAIISTAAGIGVTSVVIVLLRKRRGISEGI